MSNTTTDKFPHIELLEDEKLAVTDLPKEIQASITEFETAQNALTDESSEEDTDAVMVQSVSIANAVQDWLDEEDKKKKKAEKEKKGNGKAAAAPAQSAAPATPPPAPAAPATPPAPKPAANKEKEILAALDEKGCIHYKKLKEIVGRNLGDTVKEGNLVLHNVYMTDFYQKAK